MSGMAGRILITGDKHGTFSPLFGLAERHALYDSDILIIAGDAGYVWDEDYLCRVETLQQLFPGTVAFVDGNHENHALLEQFPVQIWNGGRAHQVSPQVYHLMRGEIYSIYGTNLFAFGGARSTDQEQREPGKSWWQAEEPSPEEMEYGQKQLMEHRNEIHYVVTHETPLSARAFISRKKAIPDDYRLPAVFEDWYQSLSGAPQFKRWYFGHMHEDLLIAPQLRGIHNHILPLGEETLLRWA
ncbi:MAG: hypothetical protein HFG09_00185 [Oscillibacter sp.]|nr:hypothetical protein [Oscillibacter sp.]